MDIIKKIADELNVKTQQVTAAVGLLDEGSTVPFISRYRKEVTGGLDDQQLRDLDLRLRYLRELADRKETVLTSIKEQEKLTPELEAQIKAIETKTELEDIYLPFKPKRRTKATIAKEAGLEPLANQLFENPELNPEELAQTFVNDEKGVADVKAALDGAKQILMERFSEDAALTGQLRRYLWENGTLVSNLLEAKKAEAQSGDGQKFKDYFEYSEALNKVPSHRALAVFRGRNEGFLSINIGTGKTDDAISDPCEQMIANHFSIEDKGRLADSWLREVVRWTWKVKLLIRLETDLLGQLREAAEDEAIRVFAENLKAILLAPPAGNKVTIGLDPGLRTGVKIAVVDNTGKYLEESVIYPHQPQNKWDEALNVLAKLCKKHNAELLSIGNGTASRETDKLAAELIKKHPEFNLKKVMVNEAGASIYSASDIAREEFPDLDVTVRGAISIARRLQDPLAELVKIEPKSIGVGQYQHDVSQLKLSQSLDAVIEDCVNAVGVDVNMASAALLKRVSGLNASIAGNIVEYRNQHGEFNSRADLKSVSRFGEKTFEQAAGFLRIVNGSNPLDASAVHPESYSVLEKIIAASSKTVNQIMNDSLFVKALNPKDYIDEHFGLPTVTDIIAELEKPGRDPRPEFKTADFKEGVEKISDLKPDMILEGVVTNVTNFGACVDVGVHQDGLVHISVLSDSFVKDPHKIVKTGDVVKVKVMEVDAQRKRIGLSMRLNDSAENANTAGQKPDHKKHDSKKYQGKKTSSNTSQAHNKTQAKQPKKMGSFGDLLKAAQEQK